MSRSSSLSLRRSALSAANVSEVSSLKESTFSSIFSTIVLSSFVFLVAFGFLVGFSSISIGSSLTFAVFFTFSSRGVGSSEASIVLGGITSSASTTGSIIVGGVSIIIGLTSITGAMTSSANSSFTGGIYSSMIEGVIDCGSTLGMVTSGMLSLETLA